MRTRWKSVLRTVGFLAAAGFLYTVLYLLGIQIPCVFHRLTGLYCPGCGISRMCISILRLDFLSALRYNSMVILLIPVFLFLGIQLVVRYVRTGSKQLTKGQQIVFCIMAILLMLFGILRNLPSFSFLCPPV